MSTSHKANRSNQTKNFQNCSKLIKTRKDNETSSCHGFLKLPNTRKSKRILIPTILSLPDELITEVLAHVAAHSFHDFINVKLCCKIFYRIAENEDKYILQHVSLEKFPVIPWYSTKQAFFLEKCRKSAHPEALYREGMVEYFNFARVEEGLKYLNAAAKAGHMGASYVLGVILICAGRHEEEQKGRRLLNYVRSKGVRESRKKLKEIVKAIWLKISLEPKFSSCPMQEQHTKRRGWPSDDEDDLDCEACGCDLEVNFVCNLLHGIMT